MICEPSQFEHVLKELFLDNVISWERIASMYVFAGLMINHYGNENDISNELNAFVEKYLNAWICNEGGWDSFANRYRRHSKWLCVFHVVMLVVNALK